MKLAKFFPILDWLVNYKKSDLQGDLSAGLTVGIMLIPQGMAYSMLAGLDPIHGLYAVTIPILMYAIFGTSRQLAVGPVAMVSLLTASSIASLNPESPEQYLSLALTLAFLIGAIQVVMGLIRVGFIVNFLSHPVINGFTSAAAIIIGLSQVKHLLKIDLPNSEHVYEVVYAIFQNINQTHLITLGIGILGIIIIKYVKKIHKNLPAPLLAVVVGILLVYGFNLTDSGVKVLGNVPSGLPTLSYPSFDLEIWKKLFPIALTISMVGFAESFAVAKTIQGKHKNYKLDANQELIGLGMANFGAAFFKGYPVTGGFSRTAVNNQAGAKTALASIISVTLIVLTLLFFTKLFFFLPNSILAAVVLVAVSGLIDFKTPKMLWKKDKQDFIMLLVTFLAVLFLGIEIGIVIGMILSLLALIYNASRPHVAELGRVPNSTAFRNIARFSDLEIVENRIVLRIDGPIYFGNVEFLRNKVEKMIEKKGSNLKAIIFSFESVTSIDSSGAHELEDWFHNFKLKNYQTIITGAKGPVRDQLNRWNLIDEIGKENVFLNESDAFDFLDQTTDQARIETSRKFAI